MKFEMIKATSPIENNPHEIVWGAEAIAVAINLPTARRAFHLLESGQLPGARRIGRRWCLDLRAFRATFVTEAR